MRGRSMTFSRVISFDDPNPFQSALQGTDNEVFVTSGRSFRADLTQIEFSRVRLQRCIESLPTIRVGAIVPGQFSIEFLTDAEQADLRHCGLVVHLGDIVVEDSRSMHRRSETPCRWASLSMQDDHLAAAFVTLTGHDLLSRPAHVTHPRSTVFSKLAKLHCSAARMANTFAGGPAHSRIAHALDQALATALVMCLIDEEKVPIRTPRGRSVIARLEEFLAEHQEEPIYIAELCAATDATERMLRAACHEHLGMGAMRYLWLRRMHMAHRLFLSASQNTTVTEIAMRCGFWELGRFAVQYLALFGRSPSASLHQAVRERAR
jgi:AraC-like DNA-binding protein